MFGSGIIRVMAMAAQRAAAKKVEREPEQIISARQLKKAMPFITDDNVNLYLEPLNITLREYNIDTPLRIAHFLAQIGHESMDLSAMRENLNYSGKGLWATFRKYFKSRAEADSFARQPKRIANRVYANRLGNGNETSGDGWKYRGGGPIQLTGKDNYEAYSEDCGEDLVNEPELIVMDPVLYTDSAGWFWSGRGCNDLADDDDIVALTRRINGGRNGLSDRKMRLAIAKKVLGA